MIFKPFNVQILAPSLVVLALLNGCNPEESSNQTINDTIETQPPVSEPTTVPDPTDPTDPIEPTVPAAVDAALNISTAKVLQVDWQDVQGATHYVLLENADGESGFEVVVNNIAPGTQTAAVATSLHLKSRAQYIVQSCNSLGCTDSPTITIAESVNQLIGYLKPNEVHHAPFFGGTISLSDDGKTMAVGADQARTFASGSGNKIGNVYVFTLSDEGQWQQQARLVAIAPDSDDAFGRALSLSGDGQTLVIGAPNEDSSSRGVNSDATNNDANNAGAVYVFTRNAEQWTQVGYLKAHNADAGDKFGTSVAVNTSGSVIAVGAIGEQSNSRGIDTESNNSVNNSGAVYLFERDGDDWQQTSYVKAFDAASDEFFGHSVSLDSAGTTLAVGANLEDSNATGIDGDAFNAKSNKSGAVYVYSQQEGQWSLQAFVKASNTDAGDNFGQVVRLSSDGQTLAVSAPSEKGAQGGVDGDQSNNDAPGAGAVYVFARTDTTWQQQAYLKASNPDQLDRFGTALAISQDGNFLAISANGEASDAIGIDGNEFDNSLELAGAAYVFKRELGQWSQISYVKASNTDSGDRFGAAIELSRDGKTLVVGAKAEKSIAIGFNATELEQADNSAISRGAVYFY